jgi:hypothetical protein
MLKVHFLVPLVLFLFPTLLPDEGQWLPQQVREMDWEALRARGMRLSKDEFWHPERGGVLSAAVQINGCSASFVSPDGLVVTNHHCGFSAINALSTVEDNYLRDGFAAPTMRDELPARGMVVSVVRKIVDVTDRIQAAQEQATNDLERAQITDAVIRQLVEEGEREPNTTCSVASFYEGREYNLYYRTTLTDVRLVYAPPRAVGEFGGEVDNWEWPRHTGDFSFFRAYCAPDGSPADYSPDNVPFQPDHYLRVSRDGVQDGDLCVIMGYPGRTERYLTSVACSDRQTFFYPKRLQLFTDIISVMEAASVIDEETALRYASTIKSFANVQKNAEGMIWGFDRNQIVLRKKREEAAFREWVSLSEARQETYGGVLDDVMALEREEAETQEKDLLVGLLGSPRVVPLLGNLIRMVQVLSRVPDEQVPAAIVDQFANPAIDRDFDIVQLPILRTLLAETQAVSEGQRFAGIDPMFPAGVNASIHAGDLIGESTLTTAEGRRALLESGRKAALESDDPLMRIARELLSELQDRARRQAEIQGRRIVVGKRWIQAQQDWRGATFYPDANSTLRVSICTVKGYEPRDGLFAIPHTTVDGVLRKETGEEPFASPEALLAAAEGRLDSKFFDWRIGDVPVCFLTDGDTTGGNSGSPVINGRGELVGLNFDRVFENVSGDYGWSAERSRNISVDIRYVLWNVEQVLPLPRLLVEMGVAEPAAAASGEGN